MFNKSLVIAFAAIGTEATQLKRPGLAQLEDDYDEADMYRYYGYFPQIEADDFLDDAWNEASNAVDEASDYVDKEVLPEVLPFLEENAESLV